MSLNYLQRVSTLSATKFWVNNPTGEDLRKALAAGAVAGTTNPAYCQKLLQREPELVLPIIDRAVAETNDDLVAADIIYQRATERFMEAMLPLYEQSGGRRGLVTMQDDPCRDHSAELIVESSLRHSKVGRNYMAKIPVTESGMAAMAELIGRDIPICATECFSIAQTVAMCELFERASARCGKRPPFFITHITGIYDEELADFVERNAVDIAPETLRQAGCIVARKEYRLLRRRGYHAELLGGGARDIRHFTEFVGGDLHITMNWSTMAELIENDAPVTWSIEAGEDPAVVEELRAKIPDFRRAYDDDGLAPEEFEGFAPLQRFRNAFVAGCGAVLESIAKRRSVFA